MKSARIMAALLMCAASLFGQLADGDKIAACRQIVADKECPEEKLVKAYEDIINLTARSDRNAAVNEAMKLPAVADAFQQGGIAARSGTPAQFANFIASEILRYAAGVRAAGIQAEN